jgi:2',3'-cyclic-nucleotide 2'-phosphodiesterase (5'-nucleotidase family)
MNNSGEITLVQINDTHAYFELHPELFWSPQGASYRPAGGYARIAALLKQIREQKPGRVLAFDGGDTLHGTYAAVQTKGAALLPILNSLALDGMTGHWDFAYGPKRLKWLASQLNYPMLAANCFDETTNELIFPPYSIYEAGGIRVGVIGLAAYIVDKTMPAHFSEGIRLTIGNEELPPIIRKLREEERVGLVVVVSHLGFSQDMQLAQEVDGIDVVLSAHTHNRLFEPARTNNTLIIQSGCHGSFVGQLDLTVENGKVVDARHRLITVEMDIPPDSEVEALVNEALAPYRQELSELVGHTDVALNRNTVLESTMDNFLLSAILAKTGAEIAFSNGWRYGAPVPVGEITLNDLYNITPMNPPVSVVEMRGEEIWAMLEENAESTFARSAYDQMGGYFKRSRGLNIYLKIENPKGQRTQEIFAGSERLDPKRIYTAAFVTTQGVPAKYGQNRREVGIGAVEAMREALERGQADGRLMGNVVAV